MSNHDSSNPDERPEKIAIACQGGGSHTAFTAGVLKRLLAEIEPERFSGFSGASGGAACALLAWYGLHTEGPERARELLDAFWDGLAARTPWERAMNDAAVNAWRMQDSGLWTYRSSPYDWGTGETAQAYLRDALEAQVDFDRLESFDDRPTLHVSAVDVDAGQFRTFNRKDLTVEHVLASMAVPSLFPAVELPTPDGGPHYHWDGLFSQNPPIRDFLSEKGSHEAKPDAIWIVQVDPQKQVGEPRTLSAIADRRDELSANLSLNQEVFFIEQVNEWLEDGTINSGKYKRVRPRRIQLVPDDETEDEVERAEGMDLSPASKLDRSPRHLQKLEVLGDRRAREFLGTVRPIAPT